ncbi:hypothetical protein SELMODRAFT_441515 [Selaginella moellendorffii]|uniref:Uncharacterized protein n=1 Tax=Selaginella moellendorffii TaxID=88036 RepID=D8RK97_SELML|nr:WPP domain-associated protein [Selaginella moellendorffii]XP_024532345.1 WPP domain-associated protein [Selaginella moellendorffii]EFJ27198.1 hypothetical protein SELMODRAFT_441515 [Selaginella moellendorffii]|eukprot:XP_024532344.1 WPP domain-associated protein [Selaginella moellendorffii]
MPSAFKSSPRHQINIKENGVAAIEEAALSRRGSGDFGYDEDAFTRLKVAQDCLIEDLECKIVVSSVVGQSVLRGIVRALSDESLALLAEKNAEIGRLESEKSRAAEESSSKMKKLASEFLEKMKENEMSLLEKERDLSKMAENLIDLTFRLQGESLNSVALEKKIKDIVARDSGKQRRINALSEEIEDLKRERSSEVEMLRSEIRIKAARHREQLEEVAAENEALREENLELVSTISALEKVNEEVCHLIEAQKESMEAMEGLQSRLEEERTQHEQEINILMDVYEGQVEDFYSHRKVEHETEMDKASLGTDESVSIPGSGENTMSQQQVVDEMTKMAMHELEKEIILDCFTGFSEDIRDAADFDPGRAQGTDMARQGSLEFQKYVRYCKSRSRARLPSTTYVPEGLIEQHHQYQIELDVLLEYFVRKLQELASSGIGRSDSISTEDVGGQTVSQVADLQRENAKLRREKEQVLVEKTEEMFRLKRDFFKELDKLKLEGGQYEFGILKKQFADSRQKLDRILDKRQGDSCQPSPSACIDEHSDTDSVSSRSESFTNDYGRFTEELPVLVSELQNDIQQLMLDTGMAKPDDSTQRTQSDVQHDLSVLSMEYESALKALEDEKRQNFAFTVELQELEHNINLSNGELERLLKQIEMEKQARMNKEGELQNVKQDACLIKRQLDVVLAQLETERAHKTRIGSELELATQRLESLQKELNDVLKVKAAIAEDHKKLRGEVSALHRGIFDTRNDLRQFIEKNMKTVAENFATVGRTLEENDARIAKLNKRMASLSKYTKAKDVDRKRKLSNYLRNLRKAEEEVDLLGDENDYLVNLLERVFVALEHYSAALRHYPGIVDLSKLIKEELVARVEH